MSWLRCEPTSSCHEAARISTNSSQFLWIHVVFTHRVWSIHFSLHWFGCGDAGCQIPVPTPLFTWVWDICNWVGLYHFCHYSWLYMHICTMCILWYEQADGARRCWKWSCCVGLRYANTTKNLTCKLDTIFLSLMIIDQSSTHAVKVGNLSPCGNVAPFLFTSLQFIFFFRYLDHRLMKPSFMIKNGGGPFQKTIFWMVCTIYLIAEHHRWHTKICTSNDITIFEKYWLVLWFEKLPLDSTGRLWVRIPLHQCKEIIIEL